MSKIILRDKEKVLNEERKDKEDFLVLFLALKNVVHFGIRTVEGRYSTFSEKGEEYVTRFFMVLGRYGVL